MNSPENTLRQRKTVTTNKNKDINPIIDIIKKSKFKIKFVIGIVLVIAYAFLNILILNGKSYSSHCVIVIGLYNITVLCVIVYQYFGLEILNRK